MAHWSSVTASSAASNGAGEGYDIVASSVADIGSDDVPAPFEAAELAVTDDQWAILQHQLAALAAGVLGAVDGGLGGVLHPEDGGEEPPGLVGLQPAPPGALLLHQVLVQQRVFVPAFGRHHPGAAHLKGGQTALVRDTVQAQRFGQRRFVQGLVRRGDLGGGRAVRLPRLLP